MRYRNLFLCRAALTLALCFCLVLPAAADSSAGAVLPEPGLYCFSREELEERESLEGVFFTALPQPEQARVLLGTRVLRSGDAVSRGDLSRVRLEPVGGGEAELRFLPLEGGRLGEAAVLTFHLEEQKDEAPRAVNGELETWRNLPNRGQLKAEDDGDGALSFRLENRPRRGSVELAEDGSFVYTPRKNKVGEDSFSFTVTDAAGNVSAPATVRITIRKPTDAQTFADLDRDRQFEALWLRETGLFGGEIIDQRLSFGPERTVSRGEYLAMVMDLAGINPEIGLPVSAFADAEEAAPWLRPYLASALRRGFIRGESGPEGLRFRPNEPITQAEAEALAARVLGREVPVPAAGGMVPSAPLTRLAAAKLLYEASRENEG